jgi:hypothetical protein
MFAPVGLKLTVAQVAPELSVKGIWLAPDQPGSVRVSGVSVLPLCVVET